MFDNIKLFTKTDNKVQEPNSSWTAHTTIHCSFELNLGFGTENVIWDTGNSIKLKQLINYFVELNKFVLSFDKNEFTFCLKNNEFNYMFNWGPNNTRIKVSRQYYDTTELIMEKWFSPMDIINLSKYFFINIISILSNETNNEVCSCIGELFYERYSHLEFEFKIGQKVETILGENVKTKRTGIIAHKFYHEKEKTTMYQLLIGKQILDKRYLPTNLRLIE